MTAARDPLVLRAGDARLTVDPALGARFSSLTIGDHEVLLTDGAGPIWWGCYPMAPFAGRIRHGRFSFRGRAYQLERNLPPHAIHGTVFERPWRVVSREADRCTVTVDLGPGWPFPGRVVQAIELRPDGLDATLTLEAAAPMPAWLGWHPWFRRRIAGASAELAFEAGRMFARDADGLPTGRLSPPGPGPWDDAFVDVRMPPRLTWPGVLSLELTSPATVWVVFDERADGICVEPQTAPPDAINLADDDGWSAPLAEPGAPVSTSMSWRWSRHS